MDGSEVTVLSRTPRAGSGSAAHPVPRPSRKHEVVDVESVGRGRVYGPWLRNAAVGRGRSAYGAVEEASVTSVVGASRSTVHVGWFRSSERRQAGIRGVMARTRAAPSGSEHGKRESVARPV